MAKIKVLVAAGVDFPAAVKAALGMTIREFAAKYDLQENTVSAVINSSTPYPYERVRDALAEELGVDRKWIDEHAALPGKAPGADADAEEQAA